jgi:hypothetical protein
MCTALLLGLDGSPSLLMTSCTLLGMEFCRIFIYILYTWGFNFTGVYLFWMKKTIIVDVVIVI